MKFSQLFFQNNFFERDNKGFELIDLMRKACFVHQDSSGIYSWLSLGLMLERKVERIIIEEMEKAGFTEIRMSLLQDADLWRETNRIETYGEELFTLKNRKGHDFTLSATCEELVTNIVRTHYNRTNMNVHVFQIGNKYRDELRAKAGLMRAKEFIMKDAYSFCAKEEDLEVAYQAMRQAYCNVFDRLGLQYSIHSSDNGEIGGKSSEEFHVVSQYGEAEHGDQTTLEIAHIFNLGTEYSSKMKLYNGSNQEIFMGCYGIGISRLVMALLEQQRDQYGFYGTEQFNTFDIVLSVIDYKDEKHQAVANDLFQRLTKHGYRVLIDDRDIQAGKKLADSELIGVRYRWIISKQNLANNQIEVLDRKTMTKSFIALDA